MAVIADTAGRAGLTGVRTRRVAAASPTSGLVASARVELPYLIVIGASGHSALREALLGSVAGELPLKAPCPTPPGHGHAGRAEPRRRSQQHRLWCLRLAPRLRPRRGRPDNSPGRWRPVWSWCTRVFHSPRGKRRDGAALTGDRRPGRGRAGRANLSRTAGAGGGVERLRGGRLGDSHRDRGSGRSDRGGSRARARCSHRRGITWTGAGPRHRPGIDLSQAGRERAPAVVIVGPFAQA